MRPTLRRSVPFLFLLVFLLTPLLVAPLRGADNPQGTLLVPDHAFPGGVLTGVVLGPDDKPMPNAPVEIGGGVPITLSGVVIGEEPPPSKPKPDHPQPCQPDANGNLPPGCPPARPTRLPTLPAVNAPQDCAGVLQQAQQLLAQPTNQGVDHILIGLSQPSAAGIIGPSDSRTGQAGIIGPSDDRAAGGGIWISKNGGGTLTDAQGRFAVCVGSGGNAFFKSIGGLKQETEVTEYKEGGVTRTPTFVQPNQHINLHGMLRQPGLQQGGNTWLVPAVYSISGNGKQVITAFKTPRDLQPGPVKFTFTDPNNQPVEFTGGVFKVLSATLDRSKLRSQEGADFEYTVQMGDGSVRPCVSVSVIGPVDLVQAPPREVPVDANGIGRFGGKIRANQVAPGSAVPFDIVPDITDCREAAQPGPQGAGQGGSGSGGTPPGPANSQYTGTTLVNPLGRVQWQGPITAPAPTAVKPAAPGSGVSTGPSHTMDQTTQAAAHDKAPPPIPVCKFQLSAPAISNETNSLMPPATFTQQQGLNYYEIHGCNFGDTAGHVYLVFPPVSGQPGFGNAVELIPTAPWSSTLLDVELDPSFGGYPDENGLILRVVTAQGAKAELPNRKFQAYRVPLTLHWMPRSQVTLGSAGNNFITPVFKTYAPSQTQSLIIVGGDLGPTTQPETATVSRSVNGVGGPFTVQDDVWDFSALQPGFVVVYAEPFFDSFDGKACDQASGHWGSYWDSATLLRVHVQGCYHKGTGKFSSSTSFYGLTIVVRGPQGTLPWPANLH